MRIGISGGGATVDRIIEHAQEAEAQGFSSLWYAGADSFDALIAMALAGRATSRIEVGSSVVQTYPVHPIAMARQALSVGRAVGAGRVVLGLGPSHQMSIEGPYGMSYRRPGTNTEEYVAVVNGVLSGRGVQLAGEEWKANAMAPRGGGGAPAEAPMVMIGALAPRMLRVAGQQCAGTITWMANRQAIETHVAPRITEAAASAGRPAPRIVVGVPVAVCDDPAEGRSVAARQFATYGMLPNYQRILAAGGASGPADAAIVGTEDDVAAAIEGLFAAGATDIWATVFPVGDDRAASRARTRKVLADLAGT